LAAVHLLCCESGAVPSVRIHRSLQEGILHKLNEDGGNLQHVFEQAVALLRRMIPKPPKLRQLEAETWPALFLVLPHILRLESCFRRAESKISGTPMFAELLVDVGGIRLYDRGYLAESEILLRTAQQVLDRPEITHPGKEDLLAHSYIVIGLCTDVGISGRALGLSSRQKAVALREAIFARRLTSGGDRDDEVLLFKSYTDLACSFQLFNRFDEVRELCEKCLHQYKQWGSEDEYPYEYAKYYNHMAYVMLFEGCPKMAERAGKRGSILMDQAAPGTQMASLFRFDWATIMFQAGDTTGGLAEHMKIFKQRERDCGKQNPLTLQSQLHIGIMYYLIGQYQEAKYAARKQLQT
jgi:hypothetical protein